MKLLQTIDLYRNAADSELFKSINKEYREKTNERYKILDEIEDNREWMLKKAELLEALRKIGYYMDWYGKGNEKIENEIHTPTNMIRYYHKTWDNDGFSRQQIEIFEK